MHNNSPKAILLVDAQPVCRHGVERLISKLPSLQIAAQANDLAEALALPPDGIDLVIFDLAAARSKGISALRDLKLHFRGATLFVLTTHDERLFAERCLKAGASGYLMKSAPLDEIRDAIAKSAAGQLHVSDRLKALMISRLTNPRREDGPAFDRLSDKELLIVQQIGLSKNNKEIARELQISVKTIESHRSRIKTKLRLGTPQELMRYAIRLSDASF